MVDIIKQRSPKDPIDHKPGSDFEQLRGSAVSPSLHLQNRAAGIHNEGVGVGELE